MFPWQGSVRQGQLMGAPLLQLPGMGWHPLGKGPQDYYTGTLWGEGEDTSPHQQLSLVSSIVPNLSLVHTTSDKRLGMRLIFFLSYSH